MSHGRNRAEESAAPSTLDENTLNLLELAVFVEEETGFRLGLATYDVPETRDTLPSAPGRSRCRPPHLFDPARSDPIPPRRSRSSSGSASISRAIPHRTANIPPSWSSAWRRRSISGAPPTAVRLEAARSCIMPISSAMPSPALPCPARPLAQPLRHHGLRPGRARSLALAAPARSPSRARPRPAVAFESNSDRDSAPRDGSSCRGS